MYFLRLYKKLGGKNITISTDAHKVDYFCNGIEHYVSLLKQVGFDHVNYLKNFKDVGYAGGPGLVFKREAINKYNLRYNTKVGYPNKVQLGEDSLFIKSIVDSKAYFIRSSEVLFTIKDDVDNSVYFKGVTEDFVISRGCIMKIVHPHLFWILKYRNAFKMRHWRNNKFSLKKLVRLLKEGSKLSKDII